MPPFAVCSNSHCHYLFDLEEDTTEGPTLLPPEFCPHCEGRVLCYCRRCSRPILCVNGSRDVTCVSCGADVRTAEASQRTEGCIPRRADACCGTASIADGNLGGGDSGCKRALSMPAKYVVDVGKRIVFTTFSGTLTFADVAAHAAALRKDPDFDPTFSELLDFTDVVSQELHYAELTTVAKHLDPFALRSKRAFVATTSLNIGNSRMYHVLRGDSPNARVFNSVEEARRWLGLDAGGEEEALEGLNVQRLG
jgi:hypothetical protein